MAVLVCIPTNSVRGFLFLHTFSSIYYCRLLDHSHSDWREMVPHSGFDLHFSDNVHSTILAWRIPGTAEPGGLLSMGSHRVGHNWWDLASSSSSKCLKICSDSHPKPKPNLWSFVQSNQDVFKYYFIVSYRILQFLCVYVCWLTSCYILCDPVDCSPPSFSFHGILQQRILEWIALPSSRGSSWPRDRTHISCITGDSLLLSHWGSP